MNAVERILADLAADVHRGLVVDSPPGAGKSTLVVRAAQLLAEGGERLMLVAQTNEQVDDLIERLLAAGTGVPVGRLSAQGYQPTERVSRRGVTVATTVDQLDTVPIVISTAAKWATLTDGRWRWAIIDEAYQMRSDALLRIASRFSRSLFVGDPGQLDPFSTVAVERWSGLSWDPRQSAVAVLLRHNPELPVHRLPISWRLPPSAAEVVSEAFYPFTRFRAGTSPAQRRLELGPGGSAGPVDRVLDLAAAHGWSLYELGARHAVRTDSEAVGAVAEVAARLLARGAVAYSERAPGGVAVGPERVAVGTAHRDQAVAVRAALLDLGVTGVTVDTANRLQGREYDVTVVLHPLSGRRDATAFHLEAGRLCVLASRHRHACVVVARAGIAELLDEHPSSEPVHLGEPVRFPDGWEANHAVLAHLGRYAVPAG
jgi:hypothetical protein